jgi:DNA-binding response OmpR family regulator
LSRLLLLEDDPSLSKTLIKYLGLNGYEVDWAKNGEEAVDLSYENDYALYLFDINVPLLNGIDLLTELRNAGDMTPTIIISALVDVASVTKGFIAGADDYLKKPFDPEELLVRIKAKTASLKRRLVFSEIEIDLENETVYKEGKLLFLGEVQKQLLLSLVRNHPNPVTRDELMLLLEKPSDLALRVNISKLKKALNLEIKAVRGVGYQII